LMEMRVALYLQRAIAKNRAFLGDQNPPKPLMIRDVFHCATLGGAHCAGLDDKIGSLTPGKQADVVVIRTDDTNIYPPNNALGVVVQAADRGNIDTVIIGGRVRKYRGKVVGLDMGKLKGMIDESRTHLFTAAGYKPDIFAELLPKLS
jgi:5-methylthioadenosine/S-adenosylhomocysteine deaminase